MADPSDATDRGGTDEVPWWFRPNAQLAVGCIVRDAADRVLLVLPTYQDTWSAPGGVVDPGESPREAASREVREELGLDLPIGALLSVDYRRPIPGRGDALRLTFDGGRLTDDQIDRIALPPDELRAWRFVPTDEVASLVIEPIARRLASTLAGHTYLEEGAPVR